MASKKQKKTALLMPLLSARGPTPLKNAFIPPPSANTLCVALTSVGRELALTIMRVLITSSGVVAAAAAAPAAPPMTRSSSVDGCRLSLRLACVMRMVSYTANFTAMSGTSSIRVGT
jgi:hypothetical protein